MPEIGSRKVLDDEVKKKLEQALEDFLKVFKPEEK
jgi:hypothetical protein